MSVDRKNRYITQAKALKDKKVTIYTRNGKLVNGFAENKYIPIHSGKLWAYVRQLSMKEYYSANAQQVQEEILLQINWRADLAAPDSRTIFLTYRGTWYDITRIDTFEGYKDDIKLYGKSINAPRDSEIQPYENA